MIHASEIPRNAWHMSDCCCGTRSIILANRRTPSPYTWVGCRRAGTLEHAFVLSSIKGDVRAPGRPALYHGSMRQACGSYRGSRSSPPVTVSAVNLDACSVRLYARSRLRTPRLSWNFLVLLRAQPQISWMVARAESDDMGARVVACFSHGLRIATSDIVASEEFQKHHSVLK
jgi:hypothetical protein